MGIKVQAVLRYVQESMVHRQDRLPPDSWKPVQNKKWDQIMLLSATSAGKVRTHCVRD